VGVGCTGTVRNPNSRGDQPPSTQPEEAVTPGTNDGVKAPVPEVAAPEVAAPGDELSGMAVGGGSASGGVYQLRGMFHYTVATKVAAGGDYALSAPALVAPVPTGGQ
jgi:hypothetical protein